VETWKTEGTARTIKTLLSKTARQKKELRQQGSKAARQQGSKAAR